MRTDMAGDDIKFCGPDVARRETTRGRADLVIDNSDVTCRFHLGHPWRELAHGRRRTAEAGQPVAGATAPDEKLMRSPAMVSSECSVRMSSTGTEK